MDLTEAFQNLSPPPGDAGDAGSRFAASPITGFARHRIAMDSRGLPSLLIFASDKPLLPSPPVVLENLTVQQDVECRVTHPDGLEELARFSVIRCTSHDPPLFDYFLRVGAALVSMLGQEPSSLEVRTGIERLVELFRALSSLSRKSAQGFWAELFVIARARDPRVLVMAWHSAPDDRFDFNAGAGRVEVKAASGRVRRHHFSLEQMMPIPDVRIIVASLFVERAGGGTSIAELIDQIRGYVADEPRLLLHVDRVAAMTLGSSWRQARDERFDAELARSSLAFFDPSEIPHPALDVPHDVSEVRFRSDLSRTPQVARDEIDGADLFQALPRI